MLTWRIGTYLGLDQKGHYAQKGADETFHSELPQSSSVGADFTGTTHGTEVAPPLLSLGAEDAMPEHTKTRSTLSTGAIIY